MQFPLHLPRSSIGSFFYPLMGASYTQFVGDIVQGPNLPRTHHRKLPKRDRAPSMLSYAGRVLAGTCYVLQASTAISICRVLLNHLGASRTSILHKDVTPGSVRR